MHFKNHTIAVAVSLALLTGLSVPSSAHAWPFKRKNSAQAQQQAQSRSRSQLPSTAQTQEFVDARMHETLSSIDRQLSSLSAVSRAGEAPRKPGIIGPTVAGSSGPYQPAMSPLGSGTQPYNSGNISGGYPSAPVDTSVLNRRVQIQWNGSAVDLLQSMASQLNYSLIQNAQVRAKVRLEGRAMTVEQTLEEIARQINGQADIIVSPSRRTITLMPK